MDNGGSLLKVDEEKITRENTTRFQIFSAIAGVILLLVSFYLFFRFVTKHDFNGFLVFLSFVVSFVLMARGANDEASRIKIDGARQEKLKEILSNIPEFTSSQVFTNEKHDLAIAVDDQDNKLCIIDSEIRVFPSKEILELELVEDEVQLTKTSRGSQIGGAVVGGILAGGVGTVIGGLSGQKTTSNDKVKRIYVKMIVNDTKRPYVTVDFLNEKREILKKDKKAIDASSKANHWYGVLSVLIKRG